MSIYKSSFQEGYQLLQSLFLAVLRRFPIFVREILFKGGGYYCPTCNNSVRSFLPFGVNLQRLGQCPLCGSLERHRFASLVIAGKVGKARKILHFAPEKPVEMELRRMGEYYTSADIMPGYAMEVQDIKSLNYNNNQFDFIYCSHVLEHIDDDLQAMAELYRVLVAGGKSLIAVPINNHLTDEDPSITDPVEREKRFGQRDHVRVYGLDIADRLSSVGFDVEMVSSSKFIVDNEFRKIGINDEEYIFLCSKTV